MAIITPYSAFTTDDVTTANYPALAYAWTSDYGFTPGSAWVDRIHGASIGTLASSTLDANGAVKVGAVDPPTLAGVDYLPGTNDMLILCVGYILSGHHFGFGDLDSGASEAAGVRTEASSSWIVTDAGATNYSEVVALGATAVGASSSAPGCIGLMIDWNGDAQDVGADTLGAAWSFKTTEAGVHTLNNPGTIATGNDINDGLTTLTEDTLIIPGGVACALYGVYALYFTSGVPAAANLKAATQWMVANPTKGLYPGWIGRE